VTVLDPLMPLLVIFGFFVGVAPWLPRRRTWARVLVISVALGAAARYLLWRFTQTTPAQGTGAEAWYHIVLGIEFCGLLSFSVYCLTVSRTTDRSAEADRWEAGLRSLPPEQVPAVDVFLPTYNEEIDVVERSIVAALALDYPRFTVWVLDDGKRDWLRNYCAAKGAKYIRRPDNAHAKAGNINYALAQTSAPVIAVLDADFAAHTSFLYRTVGFFFSDPRIAIVQVPQHFFNNDTFQHNLGTTASSLDNEREWYDTMLPCRDAWDCAFCCGSCSVLRRDALEAVGGVPTATVTEDILLTLVQFRRGLITRYLSERLCTGLLPETLHATLIQRQRWARGHLQMLFVKDGPLGAGLSFLQRLLFFPLDYFIGFFTLVVLAFVVPLVYLCGGLAPFHIASTAGLVSHLAPFIVAISFLVRWISPQTRPPWIAAATKTYLTFRLFPTVLATLIKPFGTPFRVTPKGSGNNLMSMDRPTFWVVLLTAGLTGLGLAAHRVLSGRTVDELSLVVMLLMLNNLIVLGLVAMFVVQRARPRLQERFFVNALAQLLGETLVPCRVVDLSVSGGLVESASPVEEGTLIELKLDGVGHLRGRVIRRLEHRMGVAWEEVPETTRDRLICYLYGSDRAQGANALRPWRAFWDVLKRAFGPC
jgi:cellulose synthase (UDP-forming)